MKKVLFVVDEKKMGGVSILLEDILNSINLSNLDIDILVLHNSGTRLKNIPKKVNIIYGTKYFNVVDISIKNALKSKNIITILRKIRLIFDLKTGLIRKRIIKERSKILTKKYDTEIAFKDGFTALFVGYGNATRKIHYLHYDYKKYNVNAKYDFLFKEVLPKFDTIVAVSKGIMNDFNDIYHLENKTIVINNLIDKNKIIKKSKNKAKEKSKNEFISIGRLHKQKGFDRLIEVVNQLNKENLIQDVKFKIYGDGEEKDNLINLINKYNLNDIVYLMGQTDNPYDKIASSSLMITPSIYEPFGLIVVEALTLHTPVLMTKCSASNELIKTDYNGLVVDNNITGLYNGLKKLLTTNKIETYTKNLENYDYKVDKIIKQIENLLNK